MALTDSLLIARVLQHNKLLVIRCKEAKDFIEAILGRMLHPAVICQLNMAGINRVSKKHPEDTKNKIGLDKFGFCAILCGTKIDFILLAKYIILVLV